ncbi:hypothetical protein LDENG_00208060, partial [Lucifuga dentata]
SLDALQFAYRSGRGVDDAKLFLTDCVHKHLEQAGSYVRLLFVDFSSAFNTMQPHILVERLISSFQFDHHLIRWIISFFTNRTQTVIVNGQSSGSLCVSTSLPQGCVLLPLFFILYTDACRSKYKDHYIVKFADDSVLVSQVKHMEHSQ